MRVRTSFAGYEAYVQKLATQAAGGDLPDVAQLDYRQISQYAGSGTLLDLGTSVKDGTLRTAAMDEGLVATGRYDGSQYALPMGQGSAGFAYDSAVFAKAGCPRHGPAGPGRTGSKRAAASATSASRAWRAPVHRAHRHRRERGRLRELAPLLRQAPLRLPARTGLHRAGPDGVLDVHRRTPQGGHRLAGQGHRPDQRRH
ncbi:extracellular solute-binding protein [Streptomyces sp. M10(2022)]